MTKTVLLTGASGFIALHVLNELLANGCKVIGTVRSQSKADHITKNFEKLYPSASTHLSFAIVPDIGIAGAFDEVLQRNPEITEVLHTASPFSYSLNKPLDEAYLIPATKGTENVLKAAKAYAPQIKHVVITASYACVANRDKVGDKTFIHTEETWNPIEWENVENEYQAYTASKKLAERAAREFVENEKPNFTITTVHPAFVFGPQMFEDTLSNPTLNTSNEIINQILKVPADNTEFLDQPNCLISDVRDVAKLHVAPLTNDKLAGWRLLVLNGAVNGQVLLNIIHSHFPELDGKLGRGKPEGAEEYVADHQAYYDDSKTRNVTGIEWIPMEKTIVDTVKQILNYRKTHA